MYRSILFLSMFLALHVAATPNDTTDVYSECKIKNLEECILNKALFLNDEVLIKENLNINDIQVVEIEENVSLGFDSAQYLPKNFNALKGKDDLDFSSIELIEIKEEIEFDFDTKQYLPKGFNPLKGKGDLDFNSIELIEIEEENMIGFNTKDYLPSGFNALKGKDDLDWSKIELIEIEEDLDMDKKVYCSL